MRTVLKEAVTDHDLIVSEPGDHHPPVETFILQVNFFEIPPASSKSYRVNLDYGGHKTVRVYLRGTESVGLQGHTGCYIIGTDAQAESASIGVEPYYTSPGPAYIGGYSRLHGDSFLSPAMFRGARLVDVWIDGDQVVLSFYNASPTFTVLSAFYGTGVVK